MDTDIDLYQLLHVAADAPEPVIKASYRAMMQKLRHHPDLGGDAEKAQQLNLAMQTLCDPEKRSRYDQARLARQRQSTPDFSQWESAAQSAGTRSDTSKTGHSHRAANGHARNPGYPPGGRPDPAAQGAHARDAGERHRSETLRLPRRAHCLFCGANHADAPAETGSHAYGQSRHCLRCEAPLQAIEELPPSLSDELRRLRRYEMQTPVTLWTSWPRENPVAGTLYDLSLEGCAIISQSRLSGQRTLLLQAPLLSAICQVRHCAASGSQFQAGLQFRTLAMSARPGSVLSTVA